jgi:hypothetical protein
MVGPAITSGLGFCVIHNKPRHDLLRRWIIAHHDHQNQDGLMVNAGSQAD